MAWHIKGNWIARKITSMTKSNAITLWPWVFYNDKKPTERLIRHEMIHLLQIMQKGAIIFYSLWLWDYVKGLIKYRSHLTAYLSVRFEKEAYAKQNDTSITAREL